MVSISSTILKSGSISLKVGLPLFTTPSTVGTRSIGLFAVPSGGLGGEGAMVGEDFYGGFNVAFEVVKLVVKAFLGC